MTGEEGITNAVDIMVGGTATGDGTYRAGVRGAEKDGAMRWE